VKKKYFVIIYDIFCVFFCLFIFDCGKKVKKTGTVFVVRLILFCITWSLHFVTSYSPTPYYDLKMENTEERVWFNKSQDSLAINDLDTLLTLLTFFWTAEKSDKSEGGGGRSIHQALKLHFLTFSIQFSFTVEFNCSLWQYLIVSQFLLGVSIVVTFSMLS